MCVVVVTAAIVVGVVGVSLWSCVLLLRFLFWLCVLWLRLTKFVETCRGLVVTAAIVVGVVGVSVVCFCIVLFMCVLSCRCECC